MKKTSKRKKIGYIECVKYILRFADVFDLRSEEVEKIIRIADEHIRRGEQIEFPVTRAFLKLMEAALFIMGGVWHQGLFGNQRLVFWKKSFENSYALYLEAEAKSGRRKIQRISRPPGVVLSKIAGFFCSRKTIEQVVNPSLADLQTEYFDALASGRKVQALWARLRGYWSFWAALGLYRIIKLCLDVYNSSVRVKQ